MKSKYSNSYLLKMNKVDMLQLIRDLEHNCEVERECNERQYKMLCEKEKYRWHDLVKNPDDLPTEDGDYIICLKRWSTIADEWIERDYKIVSFYKGSFNCYMVDMEKPSIVYAWKKIEPFDGEVE